jgi:hypothetical protein
VVLDHPQNWIPIYKTPSAQYEEPEENTVIIPFSSLSPKYFSITQKKFVNTRLKKSRE